MCERLSDGAAEHSAGSGDGGGGCGQGGGEQDTEDEEEGEQWPPVCVCVCEVSINGVSVERHLKCIFVNGGWIGYGNSCWGKS